MLDISVCPWLNWSFFFSLLDYLLDQRTVSIWQLESRGCNPLCFRLGIHRSEMGCPVTQPRRNRVKPRSWDFIAWALSTEPSIPPHTSVRFTKWQGPNDLAQYDQSTQPLFVILETAIGKNMTLVKLCSLLAPRVLVRFVALAIIDTLFIPTVCQGFVLWHFSVNVVSLCIFFFLPFDFCEVEHLKKGKSWKTRGGGDK